MKKGVNKVKFKANGLIWEVQSVQRDNEKLKVKGAECLGVTYYKDLQIFLDCTLPKELFRQTVIHELIHAFSFSFGVHLVANEKTEDTYTNMWTRQERQGMPIHGNLCRQTSYLKARGTGNP